MDDLNKTEHCKRLSASMGKSRCWLVRPCRRYEPPNLLKNKIEKKNKYGVCTRDVVHFPEKGSRNGPTGRNTPTDSSPRVQFSIKALYKDAKLLGAMNTALRNNKKTTVKGGTLCLRRARGEHYLYQLF